MTYNPAMYKCNQILFYVFEKITGNVVNPKDEKSKLQRMFGIGNR